MTTKTSIWTKVGGTLTGVGVLGTLFLMALTLILGPVTPSNAVPEPKSSSTASSSPASDPTQDATSCEPAFAQTAAANEQNQVDSKFEEALAAAKAEAASIPDPERKVLLEQSSTNAHRLAIWAHAFGLHDNPNDWQGLVDGNCLSSEGERLFYQYEGALNAKGTTFEMAEAPANAFNSGVSNGTYGVASTAGITGDRTAIKVTLGDGTVVYIMVRCGNPVFAGKPSLPDVPTDNPPPPVTPPTDTPPGTPPPVTPKNPAEDPYPRGNAPVGGGRNADPGPGTYVPPAQMEQPPDTPRVNPAPPPAAPPAAPPSSGGSGPAPTVPKPDPAPAPAPEPEAPAPSAPETGCVPIPGVMDC